MSDARQRERLSAPPARLRRVHLPSPPRRLHHRRLAGRREASADGYRAAHEADERVFREDVRGVVSDAFILE